MKVGDRPSAGVILLMLPLGLALAVGPAGAETEAEENWLDYSVHGVGETLDAGANWFDRFFGDERDAEETDAVVHLRLIQDLRFESRNETTYDPKFRLQVKLPRLQRKARLVIEGGTEEGRLSDSEVPLPTGAATGATSASGANLRFDVLDQAMKKLSFSAGFRLNPLATKLRTRYREAWRYDEDWLTRLAGTGYWDSLDGFGADLRGDIEHALPDGDMLRWSNYGLLSEISNGVEWSSEFTYFYRDSSHRAIAFDAGVFGQTQPGFQVNTYRVRTRYRRNFYRPWLFYEVIPEVYWSQDDGGGGRDINTALFLRLEILFRQDDSG